MTLSIKNDQRGVAHLALILVAVVVVAGVGFASWRVTSKKSDDKASVSSGAAVSAKEAVKACNKVFHDKDLCKFTGNYTIDKLSYKVVMNQDDTGSKGSGTFLSDGTGNSRMTATVAGQANDFISLNGGVSYMKDQSDGKWLKFANKEAGKMTPEATSPTKSVKFDTAVDAAAAAKISYKKLGKEKCGNLTCFKYQMIDRTRPKTLDYFWFDTKEYRMQRFYSKGENSSTDMVITYQKVNISAPSPTKDFAPGAAFP
jgi:hypothetical protein